MFSPSDYELAARLTGLPVPRTPAEQAAAAPVVASILRTYYKAPAPMPGQEGEGVLTSATRSLNLYPDARQPEAKVQLERRLQAGVVDDGDMSEVMELLQLLDSNPGIIQMFIDFVRRLNEESEQSGEYLSRQRPLEYDMPNFGGQYSVLNAPSSNSIPPSVQYQELG